MIRIDTHDNPYESQIKNFFQTEFPNQIEASKTDLLELLTNSILSSGKFRLGPKPSIENQYSIRQTIQNSIDQGNPIPFLMPWGSEKPVSFQTVDLAEVGAIKTLVCLSKRVSSHYSPGIAIRMRVEDASAPSLFFESPEQARLDARMYTNSLISLVKVLGLGFIEIVPETALVSESDFTTLLEQYLPYFEEYIAASHGLTEESMVSLPSYDWLKTLGWVGVIPMAQREHYFSTYRKLYDATDEKGMILLSRYMAQSLVRKSLNMLGNKDWTDYLGLSFVAPVPGEPVSRTGKRIYYRTLPENISSLHMAPWRAKGYFSVGDGIPRVRLNSWSDPKHYHEARVTLTKDNQSVSVRTDYEVL